MRLGSDPLDVLLCHDVPAGVPFTKEAVRAHAPLSDAEHANAMRPR